MVYALDDWLGIASMWLTYSKDVATRVGLTAFVLLMSLYVVGTPSARILRGILLDVPMGSTPEEILDAIEVAYKDSGYAMPIVTQEPKRLCVSLTNQRAGDCTAALFHLKDGVLVSSSYSRD